jgi:tetratricopeptide (TPR) repeat protein
VATVALAAAAGVAVGAVVVTGDEAETKRPSGAPPFVVDLAVRTDREAKALRRAAQAFERGDRRRAARILQGRASLQARVGSALAAWPVQTLVRLEALAAANPSSGAVLFHLGLARYWDGDEDGAFAAWRTTRTRDPDSAYAVRAADLLFRRFPPGLPTFIPSFPVDRSITRLGPAEQLAALARKARGRDVRAKLLYGLALQRLDRPISARREYVRAAQLARRNPEALVAAAVGRFDKEHPERAFSTLGPLTRRFPRAATVRFHLGVLLLWLSQVDPARRQLKMAAKAANSPLAREAKRLLARLEGVRKAKQR